jgi:hypothetical protein
MRLHILYVEDNSEDRDQYERDIPVIFKNKEIEVDIDTKSTFEDAFQAIDNPHLRYDLIISDTYRGDHGKRDIAVFEIINRYRSNGKFCPIIVCSSGECPAQFKSSAILSWADKVNDDLQKRIYEILELGIPQLARNLHDELDKAAGSYLWGFLEDNLEKIVSESPSAVQPILDRIIRRRAAMQLSDLMPNSEKVISVPFRFGLEYYIYPCFENDYYSLGDIIRHQTDKTNFKVILTPHCYLFPHKNSGPKADHVLTITTLPAESILGEKISKVKETSEEKQHKNLLNWSKSPAQTEETPKGRYWYLPKFLEIPHLFCDFLQINSIELSMVAQQYDRLATLNTPYAEALQECFTSFYGSVGIPDIDPISIKDLLK